MDDETQIRELLRTALGKSGYEVVTVPGVDQALSELAAKPFDLVILDLNTSGGSGVTVLELIRKAHSKIPVVIYSGYVTLETEKTLRQAGAVEVLRKDVSIFALIRQIDKILKAKENLSGDTGKTKEKKVLVVDDEQPIRKVLRSFFDQKGIKTLEAENGQRAVEIVRAEKPPVVLLDIRMPGMDGLTTLKKLLEIDPQVGVIMVTGEADDHTVKEAIEAGAYGYVLKPFDFLYLELVVMSKLIIAGSA